MRLLLTRPRADAEALAARIHALGHTTIIEPLIDITDKEGPDLDLKGVQALVFTSANGARTAAKRTQDRALTVLAVGPATAETARALGFTRVDVSTGEGVEGLARHIPTILKPANGALLHVTGTVTAGDLKRSLAPQGFVVRTEQLYEARAAESLSGALTAELSAGLLDGALFFSPRTAALFSDLICAAGLASHCAGMRAFALSEAVANALAPLAFREIAVARTPTADAVLDLIEAA
jgi:uroporphyrinogen-III synthase